LTIEENLDFAATLRRRISRGVSGSDGLTQLAELGLNERRNYVVARPRKNPLRWRGASA